MAAGLAAIALSAVAFSPARTVVAASSTDGSIYLWDLASRHLITTLTDLDSGRLGVNAVAFSPDGTTVAIGGWDGTASPTTPRGGGQVGLT